MTGTWELGDKHKLGSNSSVGSWLSIPGTQLDTAGSDLRVRLRKEMKQGERGQGPETIVQTARIRKGEGREAQ